MQSAFAGLCFASLAALGFSCGGTRATDARVAGAAPMAKVGPVERAIPAGATVAEDADTLASWLRDPEGPAEIWLRARAYAGDFVAKRPVKLRGQRGAELVGTGAGTVLTLEGQASEIDNLIVRGSGRRHTHEDAAIKAGAEDIVIRHVEVRDSLFGVVLGPCPRCRLENSQVTGNKEDALQGDGVKLWEAPRSAVRGCLIQDTRDLVVWYSRGVELDQNVVRNGRYGTHFMYSHDSTVRNSELVSNVVGVFVMYSSGITLDSNVLAGARGAAGLGVGFKESDSAVVVGNQLVANTTGAYLDRTPRSSATPVTIRGNRFALNETALRLHSSERGLAVIDNGFMSNAEALAVEGGGDALAVEFGHNRWSDYRGYDLDGDGTGDIPYQVEVLSNELKEDVPALRLFEGTAAFALIDAIAHASPVFSSRLLLIDPSPRVGTARPGANSGRAQDGEVAHD